MGWLIRSRYTHSIVGACRGKKRLITILSKPNWQTGLAAGFFWALGIFSAAASVRPKPPNIPWKCALHLPDQQYAAIVQEHMKSGLLGFANHSNKRGYYITINSRTWEFLPEPVRVFVFLHECAHLMLDHLNDPGTLSHERKGEVDADCWALRRGKELDLLDQKTIDVLISFVERFAVSNRFHKDGKRQAADMRSCLSKSTIVLCPSC
jgi:hypothetical protein